MKKKILAYSYDFKQMDFSKDLFLIPYYVAKVLGMQMEFLFCKNFDTSDMPKDYRGTKITQSSVQNDILTMLNHFVIHAKELDMVFFPGSSLKHMIIVWLYKHINPHGKVVIFGDMEPPQAREFNETDFMCGKGLKGVVKRYLVNYYMNNVTYLVANTEAYNEMTKLCNRHHWKGLLHFYPCLDDEKFREYGMVRKSWEEKENIMVCVGRIGNYQKNTEMLLDALKKTDLKDWKIYMIGPVTSSFDLKEGGEFQKVIDQFFEDYPQYKEKLIFTGMIYSQKEVMEYYNRAKVLLMTSRHEAWGNVYSEAAALGCYIISTEVGGAMLCSNNWKFGTKVEQENSENLADTIQNMIDGKIEVNTENCLPMESLSYERMTRNVLLPKMGF